MRTKQSMKMEGPGIRVGSEIGCLTLEILNYIQSSQYIESIEKPRWANLQLGDLMLYLYAMNGCSATTVQSRVVEITTEEKKSVKIFWNWKFFFLKEHNYNTPDSANLNEYYSVHSIELFWIVRTLRAVSWMSWTLTFSWLIGFSASSHNWSINSRGRLAPLTNVTGWQQHRQIYFLNKFLQSLINKIWNNNK